MNILLNILCVISFVIFHEMGHMLLLKYYKIPFKLKTNVIATYVEIKEQDINKIKNKLLYWSSGTLSTIIIGLLFLFLGLDIKYGIYGIIMGIFNIILIIPGSDAYRFFNIDKFINWKDDNIHLKGLWILIGNGISFILSILIILKILFRM